MIEGLRRHGRRAGKGMLIALGGVESLVVEESGVAVSMLLAAWE